ncbi:MFS transporter [Miltoncostaea marina]|uniref:MFS transporter n=1 Tax=Miltoncostaea marina TaxID=2843215 RepID=UPI001C3CCCFB|nr:MFS transporter [Miltoncostaea marina]
MTTGRPAAGRPPAYAALLAGAFLVYASANAPVPIAGELRAGLGLGAGDAGVFLLPFAAGFGLGSVLWLALARRRAPRLLLPLALTGAAAATAVFAATGSAEVAVASRVLLGAVSAGYPAVAQAVIARTTPAARLGRRIGGFVAAVVAGSFIGQALTGALADAVSPPTALLALGVAAPLAVAAVLLRAVPPGVTDAPGAPGAARGGRRAVRGVAPVLGVAALAFGGYWLLMAELPAALRGGRFGLSAAEAGALPAIGLLGAVTALLVGRLCDRLGRRAPLMVTLSLGIAGLAPTLAADAPLWLFAAGYGGFLAAYWAFLPAASAEVAARTGPAERQTTLMAFYAAMWAGAAVAPAAGALLDWRGAATLAMGAWALALVPAALFGGRPGQRPLAAGGLPA